MNDQDRNGEEQGGNDPVPVAAIESFDDYIRRYGLSHANEQAGGEFNGLNRIEAIERVRAEEAYRDEMIEKHQLEASPQEEKNNDATRIDEENNEEGVMSVLLADKSTHTMPVQPLIAYCETAKRMVTSRWRYGVRYGVADESGGDIAETSVNAEEKTEDTGNNGEDSIMELSLVEFDRDAVIQFMDVLISLQDHQHQQKDDSFEPSKKRRINDEEDEVTNKYLMNLINKGGISEQHIVECLKLAHYLQCRVLLDTLTSILQLSIDSHNCMAICSLADALNLKSLFESSVNFVIERLDAFQGTSSPDNSEGEAATKRTSSSLSSSDDDGPQEITEDIWKSLPCELRTRVLTMRNVMRSSVIGRGSKVSGLFFSSGREFLGIFRELLRDQNERLADAKERREEVIRERTEEWHIVRQRRWFDASSEAKQEFVYGAGVSYALEKIEKQSHRLQTLESFYEEQKTIFKGGGDGEINL